MEQLKEKASDELSRTTLLQHPLTGEVYLSNHLYRLRLGLPHTSLSSFQETLSYLIECPRIGRLEPLPIGGISQKM